MILILDEFELYSQPKIQHAANQQETELTPSQTNIGSILLNTIF